MLFVVIYISLHVLLLQKNEYQQCSTDFKDNWFCIKCCSSIFPFNYIDDVDYKLSLGNFFDDVDESIASLMKNGIFFTAYDIYVMKVIFHENRLYHV